MKTMVQGSTGGIRNKSGGPTSRKAETVRSLGKAPNGKPLDIPERANSGKKPPARGKTIPGKKGQVSARPGTAKGGQMEKTKADNGRRKDRKVHVTRTLDSAVDVNPDFLCQPLVSPLMYPHGVLDCAPSSMKIVRVFIFISF